MFVASAATPLMGIGLIEASREFDAAAFRHTFDRDADVRQVWDAAAIHPQLLGSVKNSLNGLTFGFGVPRERIATAVIARNSSTLFLFDSAAWKQYRLGELFAVRDPRGAAVAENVFWPSRSTNRSAHPSDPRGFYQDASVQTLQRRDVAFCVCNTALVEQSQIIVNAGAANGESAERVAATLRAHVVPGAMLVPSGVAAVAYLQSRYRYSYQTEQSD
jgi:hypothetical protein